ncbi:nitronate monooxygenase [Corynebacterium sp. ES2794-CONJ1]|uniref:nitronate monooxygenase n=1 Tax=unclassified Corynebacterium TaxID=2624378 RepID=UPI002169D7D6|nr:MULTISPECIES: nitronate monooxygenase [unclassified Corynebacterium]MCS4489966.1 nitronate monooxygenase [Corynebacterium sp. ES2775-CONJ]MCS4491671.1 nitronate monooxygenase [Corynebacterium sp. ES2715-CONJ3]MCS4531776.1 nitronate monooxygenase [Corynebacterium sp. ES2730-CONJ]MCU9519172.1 nitronate monooxygenase [Corynebacterium sp. ES2794-CONJ1]
MSVLKSLRYPIIAAPMAGGPSTPDLVNAVGEAGGFGFLAGGTSKPKHLIQEMDAVHVPYGVNLYYPQLKKPKKQDIFEVYEKLDRAVSDENLKHPYMVPSADYSFGFSKKFQSVLELKPTVVSSSFGCFSSKEIKKLHTQGIEAWVSVTNAQEAHIAEKAGADALIVQGYDAGGHRLSFDPKIEPNQIPTYLLVQEVSEHTETPLIAAGGVRTARQVEAMLEIKQVHAVCSGSIFLRSKEAGTSKFNRKLIKNSSSTVVSRAFSGRYARGIPSSWSENNADLPFSYPELAFMTATVKGIAETKEFAYCLVGADLDHIKRKRARKIIQELFES